MIHHLWFYLKQCTRCPSLHGALLIVRLATVGVFVQWGVCYITFLLFRGMSILLIPKWFYEFIVRIGKRRNAISQHNQKFTTTFQYIRSDPLFIGIESGAKTSWLHFLICADPYRLHFKDNPVTDVRKLFAIASSLISRFAASIVRISFPGGNWSWKTLAISSILHAHLPIVFSGIILGVLGTLWHPADVVLVVVSCWLWSISHQCCVRLQQYYCYQ